MTNEEAKKMLKAKLECFKNETSGINHDCNMRLCDGCSLNYEQGNMGEQKEALDMAIKALEQQPCDEIHGSTYGGVSWGGTYKPQQPCEDCISRKELINELKLGYFNNDLQEGKNDPCVIDAMIDWAIRTIKRQPSVTPSYNSVKSELISSEDCISRQKLLSRIDAERKHLLDIKMDGAEHVIVHHARRIIEDMPSITPKALEQQPCEDCISRTELLSRIDAERKHLLDQKMDGAEHIIVHHARRIIEDMPSASSVDCIDRQKTIAEIQYKYYDNAIGIDIVDMIAHMPAAIPEQLGEHFAEGYKKGVGNEQIRT